MTYSLSDVRQWLLGAFNVYKVKGEEFNFPCPVCEHGSFFFNIRKQVGFCHRASCHRTLTLDDMINTIGYSPDLAGYVPAVHDAIEKPPVKITLPKGSAPILENSEERDALFLRGVTWELIKKFNIHQSKTHIIVPIYENGVLVQYNSRRVNKNVNIHEWFKALPTGVKRYEYASGVSLDFFLGWEECKGWDKLVLVENTFVSMWLRDLNCTTNFGSHLSAKQIDKIVHSNVKKVILLWDEGADMQKAQNALRCTGIDCRSVRIEGQPDNHSKETLKELINNALG